MNVERLPGSDIDRVTQPSGDQGSCQSSEAAPTTSENRSTNNPKRNGLNLILIVIAGSAFAGLLMTVIGVYVVDHTPTIVAGAVTVSFSAIAWMVFFVIATVMWLKSRL